MMNILKKNWKVILKGIGAVAGIATGVYLSKDIYNEVLCEERELGDVIVNNSADEVEEVEF